MTSTITDTHRRVEISEVSGVTVTEIVEASGEFIRSIRILGDAGEVMEVILRGDSRAAVEVTAPEQAF